MQAENARFPPKRKGSSENLLHSTLGLKDVCVSFNESMFKRDKKNKKQNAKWNSDANTSSILITNSSTRLVTYMLSTSTSGCCVSSTCTSLWLKLPCNTMYTHTLTCRHRYPLANAHRYMEEHQTYNAHKSRIVLYLPLILNVITAEFRSQPKRCLFWILFLQTTQGFNFLPYGKSFSDKLLHAVWPKDGE